MDTDSGTTMLAMARPALEKRLVGHQGSITGINFCKISGQIATSSTDSYVMIWKNEKSQAFRFAGHTDEVTDVCFSHTGKLIASSSLDKTVRLWEGSLRERCTDIKLPSPVRSVHFSPDSRQIVTASDDKVVKVWDACRRKFLASYLGHCNWVRCVRFNNDGKVIGSCSDDKTVRLFDRSSRLCFQTLTDLSGCPGKIDFHPGGNYFAIGLSNGSVSIYDLRSCQQPLQLFNNHNGAVTTVVFDPSGCYLLSASADCSMKVIIDIIESRPVYTFEGHSGPVTAAAFSADGSMIASGGQDKQLLIWKANRKSVKSTEVSRSNLQTFGDPDDIKREDTKVKGVNPKEDLVKNFAMDRRINSILMGDNENDPVRNNGNEKMERTDVDMIEVLRLLNNSVMGLTQSVKSLELRVANLEESLAVHHSKCSS